MPPGLLCTSRCEAPEARQPCTAGAGKSALYPRAPGCSRLSLPSLTSAPGCSMLASHPSALVSLTAAPGCSRPGCRVPASVCRTAAMRPKAARKQMAKLRTMATISSRLVLTPCLAPARGLNRDGAGSLRGSGRCSRGSCPGYLAAYTWYCAFCRSCRQEGLIAA